MAKVNSNPTDAVRGKKAKGTEDEKPDFAVKVDGRTYAVWMTRVPGSIWRELRVQASIIPREVGLLIAGGSTEGVAAVMLISELMAGNKNANFHEFNDSLTLGDLQEIDGDEITDADVASVADADPND